jgi:predicted helicase
MRGIGPEVNAQISKHTRAMAEPEFKKLGRAKARTRLQRRVIASTMNVWTGNASVIVAAAEMGVLSGGLSVSQAGPPAEFGSIKYKQFGPRSRTGKVFYPATREMSPRIASLWVQTVMKTSALAMDGKR